MQAPNYNCKDIRTFIGAKDFQESRSFYLALGFEEIVIDPTMSLFKVNEDLGFYLQKYYVKQWINNSMVLIEVDDVERCYEDLVSRELTATFPTARLSPIKKFDWGRECFLHDPSGILWHFGQFER